MGHDVRRLEHRLGGLFYLLVVALRLGYVASGDNRFRLTSVGVVGVGVLYTAFLVYVQAVKIGSFCVLCMTSAALVLTLFVLHMIEHRRLHTGMVEAPRRKGQVDRRGFAALRPYAPLLGAFMLLFFADIVWANRAGGVTPGDGAAAVRQLTRPTANGLAPARNESGACEYDPTVDRVTDLSPFTTGPFKGDPDAEVRVVEVFDPNCPHCKDLFTSLDPVTAELGEQARFYYVPYPLRQESLGQIIALKLSQREGRFFDLMEEMFRRQDNTWGMTLDELVETIDAVGMDGAAFRALVEDQDQLRPLLEQIQTEANAVTEAFARPDGSMSVPKLAVEGRLVAATYASYSPRCLAEFIAEADSGAAATPETDAGTPE